MKVLIVLLMARSVDDTNMATKVLRYFEAVFLLLGNKFCSF